MNGADIIGQGWRFPIRVNAKGGLDWSSGPARIQDAIWIILSTSLGERLMRPEFGAGIQDYVFESNSELVRARLEQAISRALTQWEPRIEVVSVQATASPDPGQDSLVLVSIQYQIRGVNELYNMVYPFFLQEGTV